MIDNRQAALALGTKPVGQLLWQYALPAIVAMTASSLYNIIDRAMIGQIVGPEAIAGLGITFPLMNLSAAFGAAVGVGASTCISVKLGQKDYQTAEHLLGNTVTLNLIIGFLFMVVSLTFLDPILRFFGASDVTLPYAREFMTVILLGNMVFRYECRSSRCRKASSRDVCHAVHGGHEYPVGRCLRMVVPLGHTGCCYGHDCLSVDGALLADVDLLRPERAAASETWYLPTEVPIGEKYHSYWYIAFLDECHELRHCDIHEQSVCALRR